MSVRARQFAADRLTRDTAKAAFDDHRLLVREDLDARGVGGRIADAVIEEATDLVLEAADIAEANRGVLAGTVALLVLWFLRHPIIAWVERTFGDDWA